MPLITPIQPSFAGGEYSPSLYSRVDLEKYKSGLRTCRNFIIHPHGGASNRPGTKFVAKAKYGNKKTRVLRFVFSTDQAYIFEFGDHYIRFFTDQAPIEADTPSGWITSHNYVVNDYVLQSSTFYRCIVAHTSGTFATDLAAGKWVAQTIYELYSPYGEDDLSKLRIEESADVVYIASPDFQPRTLTRFGNANWVLDLYVAENGPFMIENISATTLQISAVTGSNLDLIASTNLFDTLHVGSLWRLRHYIEGQTASQSFSSATTGSGIKCFTTWRVISHGTWTGKFRVEKSTDGGSTWTTLRTFSSSDDFNANTSGTEDIATNTDPFLVRINMYAYTSGTATIDLTTDSFYQEGIAKITSVTNATHAKATVVKEVGLTTATISWAEGSWSDFRGWPGVCRFYQDRLCFAGTYSEPMTDWMTEIGVYTSFLRHSPLLDTDGITTPLPTRQVNAINGLVALRKLLVFTSASEWTIGPPTGSVLSPTSIEQLVQGYRGSYGIDPVIVGFECLFVQANSKVIRNLTYQLYYDLYTGSDLNIMSRHLFAKWNIIEMAYQQDPDSVVWCLRDDGILLGLTYMAEQEVVAWFWCDTGGHGVRSDNQQWGGANPKGIIESISVIPGQGFDELWMVVKRGSDRFIERMTQRLIFASCSDDTREFRMEDQFFVDCGVTFGETLVRITAIAFNDPVVITAPNHGFSNGDTVKLDHLDPVYGLNGQIFTVGDVTTNTFSITPV